MDIQDLVVAKLLTNQEYHESKFYWKNFNFYAYPVIYPLHCNFSLFPIDKIKKITNSSTIPFVNDYVNNKTNLNFYIEWAKNWDKKWQTIGTAEQLFFWMN